MAKRTKGRNRRGSPEASPVLPAGQDDVKGGSEAAVAPSSALMLPALLLVLVLLYLPIAYFSSSPGHWWALDSINSVRVFFLDDAYRYFSIRQAVHEASIPAWSYLLPVQVLLDGWLLLILGADLVLLRSAHGVVAVIGLWLLYRACLKLGIGGGVSAVSVLLLALMPLFAFVSMSFYAESWLALCVTVMAYALATGNHGLLGLATGLAPLVRPEGILFTPFVFVYFVMARRYRHLGSLLLPGLLYGFYLLLSLDSALDYFGWRPEMRKLYDLIMTEEQFRHIRNPVGYLHTYSVVWLVPGIAGLCLRPIGRVLWPVAAGAGLFLAATTMNVWSSLGEYEERYLVSILPLIAIGWAAAVASFQKWLGMRRRERASTIILAVVAGWVAVSHVLQLDVVRSYVYAHVSRTGQESLSLLDHVPMSSAGFYPALRDTVELAHLLASPHAPRGVEVLLVSTEAHEVFYLLNPARIRKDVVVGFAPGGSGVYPLLEGGAPLFAMFPSGRQFGRYSIRAAELSEQKFMLYFGELPPRFQAGWVFDWRKVYLLSYEESLR